MKIGKIENVGNVFTVEFIPNRIERFFGKKEYKFECKRSLTQTYEYGGTGVYLKNDGEYVEKDSKLHKSLEKHYRQTNY